jgi:hypothetical protein
MNKYYYDDLKKLTKFINPDIAWINTIGESKDIQSDLEKLQTKSNLNTRLLITYYNHLWEPILKLASFMGWRKETTEQNWLDDKDLSNLLKLSGWDEINRGKRFLIPVNIPVISALINKYVCHLPILNSLCLTTSTVARIKPTKRVSYKVSIVVPARNEEGNILNIVRSIPKFSAWQELIFIEGGSKDNTWPEIKKIITKYPKTKSLQNISAYQQKGRGKADAVRLGFSKGQGDMLIILDADLTVSPGDLYKFYEAIVSGNGEFINGSRLVYPMEKDAMRMLNKAGNKVFGWLFSTILGQRFKDTLCGTKVLLKKDYLKIAKNRHFFGDFDPFGDFDLIFGAVKQNMKVIEVPIRYRERVYGSTNISRFTHGLLLLKMTWKAFLSFKAW